MHRQITQLLLFSIVSMQKEQANSFVFKTFPNCRYFSIISILTKKCSGLFFFAKKCSGLVSAHNVFNLFSS